MARSTLPRILSRSGAHLTRGRELARSAAGSATDVLHPLLTITRGLRRLAAAGRRRWADTPKDRRGPLLFLAASLVLVVVLVPFGPLLGLISLMGAAAWAGRDQAQPEEEAGPDESQSARLQSLYDALVPYFAVPEDPDPLYTHGGSWEQAFEEYAFDGTGRVAGLTVHYPAYFPDGDPEARARVEHLLHAKAGRGREYHFAWDEEGNALGLSVLAPLPTGIAAQHFVAGSGEAVLGFTDSGAVRRTLPVEQGGKTCDVPPVVWRTGPRSTEPHLLAVGQPGSGTTTLIRSLALQALHHGNVLIVDGSGTGEYDCLSGRRGVLGVECALTGALASLEWAAHETERRLIAANRARQCGQPLPDDATRPLWILLDRPGVLGHLAAADGRTDPQSLLQVPLRHGRAAHVTVVVAEHFDAFDALGEPVLQHTRARLVLGRTNPAQMQAVLGAPPHTTPTDDMPAGRGYARLGAGPVLRLQVPATPDPYDEATSSRHRRAVLALLPPPAAPPAVAPGTEAASGAEAEAGAEPPALERTVTAEAAAGQREQAQGPAVLVKAPLAPGSADASQEKGTPAPAESGAGVGGTLVVARAEAAAGEG